MKFATKQLIINKLLNSSHYKKVKIFIKKNFYFYFHKFF